MSINNPIVVKMAYFWGNIKFIMIVKRNLEAFIQSFYQDTLSK